MEKVLNFNEPLDVNLLDRVVESMYQGTTQERSQAQKVLTQLQEHPDAWTRVDTILEYSRSPQTKYFALLILEGVIKYKWRALPREQCEGIKGYVVNLAIKLSSDEATLHKERVFLTKLNYSLVQIIKQEWPAHWQTFIPDIVGSSKTSESLCENNMNILKILSEEVFDFSRGQMTQSKITELKQSFNKDFGMIYELCEYILNLSQKPSLVLVTLETLLRFLNWIPIGYIFETKMIETLIVKFFMAAPSRNVTVQCLTEIGSLSLGAEHNPHFERLFHLFMTHLVQIIPPGIDLRKAYESGSEDEQKFIQNLALFFAGFLRAHITIVETQELKPALLEALRYLTSISTVDDDEVFKICLEYWNFLAADLYHEMPPTLSSPLMVGNHGNFSRRVMYSQILSRVRAVLISRMAKPEEVLIVEDENGQIVRETLKDSDSINLYKSMRETLVYLTNLDPTDTQNIMLEKLVAQVDGSEWSWHNLNTLCWAIGSISGALNEELEQRFLVSVIRDLLGLVELKRGKDNKAVIASNIMYIVGQYPRFLRAHWKFLKTVVNKLFEFMHETHPGIQDMSCDTFLKIVQKCKRKFAVTQIGEPAPFIEEILNNLQTTISDLENHQIQTVYEALGHIIFSAANMQEREALTARLMALPNMSWAEIMANAGRNIDSLRQPETIKNIANILKTNNRAASSLGHVYITQLGLIFADMLNVYKVYSGFISNTVATQGPNAAKTSIIMNMRAVKRETLRLLETFIEKTEDPQVVCQKFVPPLLEAVLGDYKTNIPDARDPEVLSLMVVLTNKMKNIITPEVPRILEAVFECTLGMITKNFEDYPEHRINFFRFIRSINAHCFAAFFSISADHFKLVIDCVVWAFKHTERNISETGLLILQEMLQNVSTDDNVANAFYSRYFLSLLQDVFFVVTDSFHKSGFKLQSSILLFMMQIVANGMVKVPLWDAATVTDPSMTNQRYVKEFIYKLVSFPNLTPHQVEAFVIGLFTYKDKQAFKQHLRDFLVQLKVFSSTDNAELYLEEQEEKSRYHVTVYGPEHCRRQNANFYPAAAAATREAEKQKNLAIPGMVKPSERTDDMAD